MSVALDAATIASIASKIDPRQILAKDHLPKLSPINLQILNPQLQENRDEKFVGTHVILILQADFFHSEGFYGVQSLKAAS